MTRQDIEARLDFALSIENFEERATHYAATVQHILKGDFTGEDKKTFMMDGRMIKLLQTFIGDQERLTTWAKNEWAKNKAS